MLTHTSFNHGCRPQECALSKARGHSNLKYDDDICIYLHAYCTAALLQLLLLLLLLCYTTTHADTSHSTTAALLLGCYAVVGLLSSVMWYGVGSGVMFEVVWTL